MDMRATVTAKGQITLPKGLRETLGLKAGDTVLFRVHEDRAVLAKVPRFST
jgi:antitoxin PrlF